MEASEEYLPPVKHWFLTIAVGQLESDVDSISVREADRIISEWIEKGYKLMSASSTGPSSHGVVQMLYVLVRQ